MIPEKTKPTSNAREARLLLRAHRYGALSTLSKKFDGHPFGSITPYLVDHDGSLLILISELAEHTKNIRHDPRVSLITHNQEDPHIQAQGRVTLVGLATPVAERDIAGKRYLRYFPEAEAYFAMNDFQFYRIAPQAIRYIGGFGEIHWVKGEQYSVPAQPFAANEAALLQRISAILRGVPLGIDCDGYDLREEVRIIRHDFPSALFDTEQALAQIRQLQR